MIKLKRVFRHPFQLAVIRDHTLTHYRRRVDEKETYGIGMRVVRVTLVFDVFLHRHRKRIVFVIHVARYLIAQRHYDAVVSRFLDDEVVKRRAVRVLYREHIVTP